MDDFTILDFTEISDPTGLKLYIVSDIADFHITYENLIKEFTDYKNQAEQTILDESKASSFTRTIDADTKLESVDIRYISGSPKVKIGTSLGEDDIMRERTIVSTKDSNNELIKTFKSSTILYITVTGGTVSIKWNVRYNYTYTT